MSPRTRGRALILRPTTTVALVFLALLVLAGCSEEKPTGPEIDPLVGFWVGSFIRLEGVDSGIRTLKLTVQAGGQAVATGYCIYQYEDEYYAEHLYLDLAVAPDGGMVGEGIWYWQKMGVGILYAEGVASGALDPVTLTGTGSLDIDTGEGILSFSWQVVKEEGP